MKQPVRRVMAAMVTALLLLATLHSLRTCIAQAGYMRLKYGEAVDDANRAAVQHRARHLIALYPWNFYLCEWTGEQAFRGAYSEPGASASGDWIKHAEWWCRRGLALNPYKRKTRLLKARLLERSDPAAAAAYWAEYTDWHYWDPYNHAVQAEFCAQAGDLEGAERSLDLARGSPAAERAADALRRAWLREIQPPEQGFTLRIQNRTLSNLKHR